MASQDDKNKSTEEQQKQNMNPSSERPVEGTAKTARTVTLGSAGKSAGGREENSQTVSMNKIKPAGGESSESRESSVVQEKKKELDERMKSQGTIRLRQPSSGPRAQSGAESESSTQATATGSGGDAKRTLKIKSGGDAAAAGGKTMKVGAGGPSAATDQAGTESGGKSAARPAASGGAPAAPVAIDKAAGPGGLAILANLLSLIGTAAAFVFLLLYYLDLYV